MITNYFTPIEFLVTIERLPNVEFFTQRATIPGISGNPVEKNTPFNRMFTTPDKLQYNNFDFSFILDENMNNYIEVYDWMRAITFPQDYKQYKEVASSKEGVISDISILVLNNNKNANIKFEFKNCFPINLSDVTLDTTSSDVIYPEATVTFQYDYFEIHKLKN